MRRILREISYDLREPGTHMLAIPVIALLFVLLTLFVQARFSAMERQNTFTLFALELLFPFLGGYAAIALMRGIFDAKGGETLFTYGKSFFYWGWIRQMRFFALYAILVAAVSVCTAAILHGSIMDIFTVTLAQCFAVMGVAFFGVCVSKRTDGGLIVLAAFVGIQLILGREYPVLNWIYNFSGYAVNPMQKSNILSACALIGLASWSLGQLWVRP